jgi:hypothetical protein
MDNDETTPEIIDHLTRQIADLSEPWRALVVEQVTDLLERTEEWARLYTLYSQE